MRSIRHQWFRSQPTAIDKLAEALKTVESKMARYRVNKKW